MSDGTTFDPDLFMSQEVEGEMETKYTPVPDGDYISTIDDKLELKEVNGTPRNSPSLWEWNASA